MMVTHLARLTLEIDSGLDADDEATDELTRRLRRELLELDVESVELGRGGPPPPGARAIDVVALGTLVVTLATSPEVLGAVVGLIGSWLARVGRRTVRLELDGDVIEVGGLSAGDQHELIRAWIERQAARPGAASV